MVDSPAITFSAETVAQLCVEFWKLSNATRKAIDQLPDGESRRLEGQLNFSDRQLSMLVEKLGFRLINFESEIFHTGLAATADNAGDFSNEIDLVVSKTLEPTVMVGMKVVRLGRIVVEPAKSEKE